MMTNADKYAKIYRQIEKLKKDLEKVKEEILIDNPDFVEGSKVDLEVTYYVRTTTSWKEGIQKFAPQILNKIVKGFSTNSDCVRINIKNKT